MMNIVKKTVKYWILGMLTALCCHSSFAQSPNQIITTILPVGGVVSKGNSFRVDVSFTYNTTAYTNYQVTMELPAGVVWPSKDFTTDISSIDINANSITSAVNSGGNTVYTIPFTPKVSGIKSTNFFLNNLINNTDASCSTSTVSNINFALMGKQSNTLLTIQTCISPLTTPQGTDDPGVLTLELLQGQELNQDNSNTGNFPYYVDVRISGDRLSSLPAVTLTYPTSKLTFINAELYNIGITPPPFHRDILGQTSIVASSGSFTILLPNNTNTYNNSAGDFIRFYFKTTSTGQLLPNDIKLSATGAKYRKCDLSEVTLPNQEKTLTAFSTVPSISVLYPSIQYKNIPLEFCPQNCDFNINNFQSKFYFEVNDIYTTFGSTIPRVRIDCPSGVSKVQKLVFDASQYSTPPVFKYTVSGSTVEQTATVSGNQVTFGSASPQVIFIASYVASNASFTAKDFEIDYTSLLTDLSSVAVASKIFNVKYESFVNTKVYSSEAIFISYACSPGMSFRDDYENNQQDGFTENISYLPGSHRNVLLTIAPINQTYSGVYTISGVRYQLNPNMTLGQSTQILFSETGVAGSFIPLTLNRNGTYYKNISMHLQRSTNSLVIDNINLNNTTNCGQNKILYLMIEAVVNTNASYSPTWYQSSIQDNAASFTSIHLSQWNVERSIIDKVSGEVKVVCPGDRQELSEFEKGQTVTVQYIINNEDQNPVRDLVYSIPVIGIGVPASSTPNGGIVIHSKNSPAGNLNGSFAISTLSNVISITSGSYILSGNDKIYVEVSYILNQNLTSGTQANNISFTLNSFKSIDGIPRAQVEPTDKKMIKVVDKSLCVPKPPCENCVTSFSPLPGQEYLLSAWIKESYNGSVTPAPKTYVNTGIQISFNDGDIADLPLFKPDPNSPIIEGWQRVEASFIVPANAYNIEIEMVNNGDNEAFFDDIRIHPFRSNMKAFVYDPSTQRLTAELDENNYATLYEYDDEGILVRIKKETQRGVMTIKESRNNQSKIK